MFLPICRFGAEGAVAGVRSYDGNFLVTAPDTRTAAEAAALGERTRQAVFDLLRYESEWQGAASLYLRSRKAKTPDGELELFSVSVARGGFRSVREGIYPTKRNDAVVLQVVRLCLEDIARAAPAKPKDSSLSVPLWLSCGVGENLSPENVVRLLPFVSDIVSRETYLPIEKLFQINDLPLDEAERELFFKESGSVADFLFHQEDGQAKLRLAIAAFRAEGDFSASLLRAFRNDFRSIPQLQEKWKTFAVERAERTIGGSRMLLSETKEALDSVLTVQIRVIDRDSLEEKVITTDLEGLFCHENKRLAQEIASRKASEVFRLRVRARPEYAPVLEEYSRALSAIARNDRRAFKKHFSSAERLRKDLEESLHFGAEETEHVNSADE